MAIDGIEFKDEDSEEVQKESSIKEIILRQIKKIGDICSKELTGGYWTEKPFKVGDNIIFVKEYHEDLRKAYCNSIEFITDLVYSYSDKTLKEFIESDDKKDTKEIEQKVIEKKKLFREINNFFNREDFFSSDMTTDE